MTRSSPTNAARGKALILKDMLDYLRPKKLLAFRTEAGEEEVRATPLKPVRFEIDAEFENLLPRAPDEVKKLEERLLVEEQREPLVVWKGHGKLVDGHTRFRFYSLLGRDYQVVEMDFPDRAAVISWLYDTHYGRRSYAPEMKSYVRGKQYLARKKQHGGARKKASSQSGNLKTADTVAAEYNIGRNTLLRDATFCTALDKVAEVCGEEVRQKVLSRAAKWTKGDVARLAKLDPKSLEEIVRVALASGKRPKIPPPVNDRKPPRKAVNLPVGKPLDQVRVLKNALGGKGLVRLQRALTRFLEKRKRHATSSP